MLQPRNPASEAPRRGLLPPALALAGGATTFTSLYLSAGALTPLLVAYRVRWDFPPSLLTVAFAVYALGFVAALLVFGPLSDHVGRRPVIVGALVIQLVSNVVFLVAPDVGWVVVGRIVQGIGTGAATSALTALLAEVSPQHRRLGTILGSVSVTGGLAVGSLLAGLALQLTASANTLIFTVLIIVTVLGVVVVLLSPESTTRAPGALRSLVPRVAVPRISRPEFVAAAPVIAAVWMLAGLSGGLAPSMVSSVFHLHSDFLNGFSGFVAPAVSAIAGLALGGVRPRATMFIGLATAVVGPALIIVGALGGSLVVMTLGQGISGFAFGAAFTASLRLIVPLAPAHQRAAVVASVYTVAYLAFGIAVVAAGYLGGVIGVVTSVTLYAAVTVLLAVLSVIGQVRIVVSHRSQPTTEKELS